MCQVRARPATSNLALLQETVLPLYSLQSAFCYACKALQSGVESASLDVGVIEEEARCTFRPQINAASEQLLEDSLQVPANFYERQRFFYDIRQERLQRLQTESVCLSAHCFCCQRGIADSIAWR